MSAFGSLSQIASVTAELGSVLSPIITGDDGQFMAIVDGERVQSGGSGELLLTPGIYLVTLSGRVTFRDAARVTVAVVLAGDVRFRGPRITVDHDHGAIHADDRIGQIDATPVRGRRNMTAWDRTMCRTLSAFKLVLVPFAAAPVPVSVWASAELFDGSYHRPRVEFTDIELSVIAAGVVAPTTADAKGGVQ